MSCHLDRLDPVVPAKDQVGHGVSVALYLQGAELAVHREVGEVHGAGRLHSEPHAPQDLAQVGDPQKLVLLGRHVEVGGLLIDKERVGNPNLLDVIGCHNQLGDAILGKKKRLKYVAFDLFSLEYNQNKF